MSDQKTKQWFVKVCYGNTLLEVVEIWTDTEQEASMYAHQLTLRALKTQIETPTETERRTAEKVLNALQNEADSLSEFIYDDYGDTVDQLGMEETAKLEQKLRQLRNEISEVVTRLA